MASYLPNDLPGCFLHLHLSTKTYTHSYGRLHQDALVWINDGNIVIFVDCNGHKHQGCRNIDKAQNHGTHTLTQFSQTRVSIQLTTCLLAMTMTLTIEQSEYQASNGRPSSQRASSGLLRFASYLQWPDYSSSKFAKVWPI